MFTYLCVFFLVFYLPMCVCVHVCVCGVVGRAMDQSKQRPQKQLSQPAMGVSEPLDGSRLRGSQSSEGSELTYPTGLAGSPIYSPSIFRDSDPSARDSDSGEQHTHSQTGPPYTVPQQVTYMYSTHIHSLTDTYLHIYMHTPPLIQLSLRTVSTHLLILYIRCCF